MKKRRIVIASVLKPVDDTRMYEKMAMTLSESGKYEVFVVGYPSKSLVPHPEIQFRSLTAFSRISLGRLLAPAKIQKILHQVQPEILIVNTHELLIVAVLNRILFGVKVIYDVRENYYRNILHTEAFPIFLRPFLALWVRLKETLCVPFIHRFILAESGYKKEMRFFVKDPIIIENKVRIPADFTRTPTHGQIRMLFSGTLAESTGVFRAIALAKKLQVLNPAIRLTIIGYCAQSQVLKRIHAELRSSDFITLKGGDQLVPHGEIIQAIAASDFGIIAYPPSRHSENAIPTKLYEYLACRLPILLQHHPNWEELCSQYPACIPLDFNAIDPQNLLLKMQSPFYKSLPEGVTWEPEGQKLLTLLEKI